MAFDSQRGVMVLFGGNLAAAPYPISNETWEYKVTNLGNGEGCTLPRRRTALGVLRGRRLLRHCVLFRRLPILL